VSLLTFNGLLIVLLCGPPCVVGAETAPVHGGKLVIAQKAEPKTLNPITALDSPSREVIGRMSADLISVNRLTQIPQPALAESWQISADGLRYTLKLRAALHFSDGHPFDADDVLFTFRVYLDENVHSMQRDLFVIGGAPISIEKIDARTVRFNLPAPYAPGVRIFDSVPMLPRHLLEQLYHDGKLAQAWGLNTSPASIAGMGPFRLKRYQPGERITLERNPYYWKQPQPYLDELEFLAAGDEDAQIARFIAGETDLVNRVSARNAPALRDRGFTIQDLGPSFEYNFLFFNLTSEAAAPAKAWFQQSTFRKAVSLAIDREGMVRLVYGGLATPLAGHVSPANRFWIQATGVPKQSVAEARRLLQTTGFKWDNAGQLLDPAGKAVEFTIISASSNQERTQMATIIQDDLKNLGMNVRVAPLEFRSMVDRILNTHEYEAAIMGMGGGDPDPDSEVNVWLSSGSMHLWNPKQKQPATAWEAEIDRLMRQQAVELDRVKRRQMYARVQQIEAEQLPFICLVSPHVLVAAHDWVRNLRPANVDHYTLWNADELYVTRAGAKGRAAVR
jgi:peptide/nickel transport system substrate-binding protein